ncbi:MAG TPA: YkvA family protein [Pirellulales bacterium]
MFFDREPRRAAGADPAKGRRRGIHPSQAALMAPLIRFLVGGRAASVLLMLAALMYTVWPIDFVPDFIPFAGQADDLIALFLAGANAWRAFSTGQPIETPAESRYDRR